MCFNKTFIFNNTFSYTVQVIFIMWSKNNADLGQLYGFLFNADKINNSSKIVSMVDFLNSENGLVGILGLFVSLY